VLSQNKVFELLDYLNPGIFNRFSNKNLKDGFYFVLKVEKVGISFENLSGLVMTGRVRDEYCIRSLIDVVVSFDIELAYHVLMVIQFLP
jgi:hypothetical protein